MAFVLVGALLCSGAMAAEYFGSYEGTFDGTDSGRWSITIDHSHHVQGMGYSQSSGPFTVNGAVSEQGHLSMTRGTISTGAGFSGQIDANGRISGVWSNTAASGNFYGQRN